MSKIDLAVPEAWQVQRLDEVADVRLGRQRSPKNHTGTLMRPYLRAANVTWGGLALDDVNEMNFTDAEMETFRLEPGDVLVNEASGSPSEVGKAAVFRGEIAECAFQNTLLRVRPLDRTTTEYLHHFLVYLARTGAHLEDARGVGIAHLGRAKLAARPVPVPSLDEQERIVEVLEEHLSRLDAALASIQAVRNKAAQFRRSLLHAAFTGVLTGGDETSWPVRTLDELNDPERPICYGILKPGPDIEGGVPYVKVRNIKGGRVVLDGLHCTTTEIDSKYPRSRLRQGDLLLSIRGTYGRTAVVPPELDGGNITQDSARIAPVGARSDYVLRFLDSPQAQQFFQAVARGVAVKGVNIRDLRLLPVPVPPPEVQERIVMALDAQVPMLEAMLAAADHAEAQCAALRRSLLHAAFTGKLTEEWRENAHV